MAKPIKTILKVQIKAGAATPGPPLGTALGPQGINIQQFVTEFNDKTKDKQGELLPTVITIYEDRSFSFVTKTPPASYLLKKAANIEKGSGQPNRRKVAKVTKAQVKEIAEKKMVDLSAEDEKAASKIIEGTARSMGIEVK